MSFDTTETDLESLFSDIGPIASVLVPLDRTTSRPRGFAFVEFENAEHADEAIKKFDGHQLGGRSLRLDLAEERSQKSRAPRSSHGGGPPKGGPSRPKGSRRGTRGKKRSL